MSAPKFLEIDGKRHLWSDVVRLRQEQCRAAAAAAPVQPSLFELHEDYRPVAERTAAGRYREPPLFSLPDARPLPCPGETSCS